MCAHLQVGSSGFLMESNIIYWSSIKWCKLYDRLITFKVQYALITVYCKWFIKWHIFFMDTHTLFKFAEDDITVVVLINKKVH